MKRIITIALVGTISACTTPPEPLQDRDQPYLGGKGAEIPPTRPQPRPMRPDNSNPDCPHKRIGQDCDNEREQSDPEPERKKEPKRERPPQRAC
jgi:hypothetical protein